MQELRRKEKTLAEAAALLIASKNIRYSGERMGTTNSHDDLQMALQVLDEGMADGAHPLELALLLGVGITTLQSWRLQFAGAGDGVDRRKGSHRYVAHLLSEEERQLILLTCNEPEFAALPRARSFL